MCDSATYSNHPHIEVYSGSFVSGFWFNCLNRADQSGRMFERSVYPIRLRTEAPKLSVTLNFTKDYLMCNDTSFNWTTDGFKSLVRIDFSWNQYMYVNFALIFPNFSSRWKKIVF